MLRICCKILNEIPNCVLNLCFDDRSANTSLLGALLALHCSNHQRLADYAFSRLDALFSSNAINAIQAIIDLRWYESYRRYFDLIIYGLQ